MIAGGLRKLLLGCLRAAFDRFVKTTTSTDHLEIERKFAISEEETRRIPSLLTARAFSAAGRVFMTDFFLPTVDGEMMRVRQERPEWSLPRVLFTRKQWVITAGGERERRECERQVRSAVAAIWLAVGRLIKGQPLLSFSKQRDLFTGTLADGEAVVSIDQVSGLGKYSGHYLEVEVLVPVAGDPTAARNAIADLVAKLLANPEMVKRSYLDMLTESAQGN